MRIGILTFHWATNYGAVLQAYALQIYLEKQGCDVQIIDYMPSSYEKKIIKCFFVKKPWVIKKNIIDFYKEKSIAYFRKKYLKTSRRYYSLEELRMNPPNYEVYICGSDQIWNPYFTLQGEGNVTTSYFLDFGNEKIVRIAYAVSFGCNEYSSKVKNIVTPLLDRFKVISVREKSGSDIVKSMGYNNVYLMPDPSLLLSAKDYDNIIGSSDSYTEDCFFYIIHSHQYLIKRIEKYFNNDLKEKIVSTKKNRYSVMSIEKWLIHIKNSKIVVTNSFHGIVLSIIYKKQFIAVPVEGSGSSMNDRIITFLEQFNLHERILDIYDENKILYLLSRPIEWDFVHNVINVMQRKAGLYIKKAINE